MKNFYFFLIFLLLSNCGLSGSAFLGPVYTGFKTGSAYQTTASIGSSKLLKKLEIKDEKKQINFKKETFHPVINEYENKILVTLFVEKVEISDVYEPEPLP